MNFKTFEDIEAWQKGRLVVKEIYSITKTENISKDYALCNQMRRAAISIISNIAEGFDRDGNKEFIQFLSIAKGSCSELLAQCIVAHDIGYINEDVLKDLRKELVAVNNLVGGLMVYLKKSGIKGKKFQ